jgi:hypothetical protein
MGEDGLPYESNMGAVPPVSRRSSMGDLTNFPDGISSFGMPVGFPTQGNTWFVKPNSGSNSNDGKSPEKAFKTLAKALASAVANQNDVVYMFAESNTAANTTDYLSSTLDWNKDGVHLIGVNAGPFIGQRSRIAFTSSYDTASNLFTLSADNCLIKGMAFFAGVAGTNPTGCLKVTGSRNRIENCQISGIGHDNNDIANAYSLNIAGSTAGENYFKDCYIGLDTVGRGSNANAEIYVTGGASSRPARTIFDNCIITGWCQSAGNYVFLNCAADSLDRFIIFKNCIFLNPGTSIGPGAEMTYAMTVTTANGRVILHNSSITGAADVANNPGTVYSNLPIPASATDAGLTIAVVKT